MRPTPNLHAVVPILLAAIVLSQVALLSAIFFIKIARSRFNARAAVLRERVTSEVLHVLEGEARSSLDIPAPGGASGSVTRETLIAFVGTISGQDRERLITILDEAGYVDEALDRLGSRSAAERARACALLGGMLSPRASNALIGRFSGDGNAGVRLAAAEALGDIGSAAALPYVFEGTRTANRWQRIRLANVLASIGDAAIPFLLGALGEQNVDTIVFSLDVLAAKAWPVEFSLLRPLLHHHSAEVRGRATELVGIAGLVDAIHDVISRTADPVWFVRLRAVKALECLGVPDEPAARGRYYACLAELLCDESWSVRQRAAAAISKAGDRGIDILQRSPSDAAAPALQRHTMRGLAS